MWLQEKASRGFQEVHRKPPQNAVSNTRQTRTQPARFGLRRSFATAGPGPQTLSPTPLLLRDVSGAVERQVISPCGFIDFTMRESVILVGHISALKRETQGNQSCPQASHSQGPS